MIIPSEYSSIDYSFYQINPSEVYLTYNDDMTYNIYFPSEFENNSEYDVNYKISVMDIDNEEVYYLIGNDRTPYLLNCKGSTNYGLGYNVFVKEDIIYYSISYYVVVSGTIYVEYDDDGFIVGQKYCDYEMLEEGLYKIRILSKVYDDIKVKITLDNSEIIEVENFVNIIYDVLISTEAKEVCLLPPLSNGDILTNLCTPISLFIYPYAFKPTISNVTLFIPASSPS